MSKSVSYKLILTNIWPVHFSIPIKWTSPFPDLGVCGVFFYFNFIINRISCKANSVDPDQRRHILRHLIWVCTVCLGPQKGTSGLYGIIPYLVNLVWGQSGLSKIQNHRLLIKDNSIFHSACVIIWRILRKFHKGIQWTAIIRLTLLVIPSEIVQPDKTDLHVFCLNGINRFCHMNWKPCGILKQRILSKAFKDI